MFFLLIGAYVIVFGFMHTVLIAETAKTERVVFCQSVREGEEFVISFTHSVNKRPVFDTIRVEGDHFLIVKSRYDAFGAGMPETSSETMRLRIAEDGWLELTGINRVQADIAIFIGTVAEHSLQIRNRKFPLTQLAEPGTSLRFRVGTISAYDFLKGRCTF